jgi:hypothetical protein
VKVEAAFWDDSGVQRLTTDQQAEIRARYGGRSRSVPMPAIRTPRNLSPGRPSRVTDNY